MKAKLNKTNTYQNNKYGDDTPLGEPFSYWHGCPNVLLFPSNVIRVRNDADPSTGELRLSSYGLRSTNERLATRQWNHKTLNVFLQLSTTRNGLISEKRGLQSWVSNTQLVQLTTHVSKKKYKIRSKHPQALRKKQNIGASTPLNISTGAINSDTSPFFPFFSPLPSGNRRDLRTVRKQNIKTTQSNSPSTAIDISGSRSIVFFIFLRLLIIDPYSTSTHALDFVYFEWSSAPSPSLDVHRLLRPALYCCISRTSIRALKPEKNSFLELFFNKPPINSTHAHFLTSKDRKASFRGGDKANHPRVPHVRQWAYIPCSIPAVSTPSLVSFSTAGSDTHDFCTTVDIHKPLGKSRLRRR